MKARFIKQGDDWVMTDTFLSWQPGVFVCRITPEEVVLATVKLPIGAFPRDARIDAYLSENVEYDDKETVS